MTCTRLALFSLWATAGALAQVPDPATPAPSAATPAPLVAPAATTPTSISPVATTPAPAPATPSPLMATPVPAGAPVPTFSGSTPAPTPGPAPANSGSTVQMAFYILLLLGLFGAGAWILRFGLPGLPGKNRADRKLHILETRSLGGRQFLVVAEYEGRKLLLGVCPGRIDHLCELSPDAARPKEPEFPKIGPEPIAGA